MIFKRRHNEDEKVTMTPEEKELLRKLMETPGIEREWDFFEDMNPMNIPPPEYFMRGRPHPRWLFPVRIMSIILSVLSTLVFASLNWGQWISIALFFVSIVSIVTTVSIYYIFYHKK